MMQINLPEETDVIIRAMDILRSYVFTLGDLSLTSPELWEMSSWEHSLTLRKFGRMQVRDAAIDMVYLKIFTDPIDP